MLGFKLIYVNKRGYRCEISIQWYRLISLGVSVMDGRLLSCHDVNFVVTTHLKEEFSLRQMPSSFQIFPFAILYIDGWARYWPIRNDFTGMKRVPSTETVLCTGNKPGRLKLNKTNTLFKTHLLLDRPPFHRRYSQIPFREWKNVIQKLNEVCS